jgi:hypothetical protein
MPDGPDHTEYPSLLAGALRHPDRGENATISDLRYHPIEGELRDGMPLVDVRITASAENARIAIPITVRPYVAIGPSTKLAASGDVYMELEACRIRGGRAEPPRGFLVGTA